ncbi:MerR family transcriptional regulator [Phaeacidiphilus oryzae]|uniref:MerR family transcriptional regulator n=1 Tax=Phaeacidiphilus oryzae TaxID=348818 RepID=UPI000ADB6B7D|nr:MerR family transcriptional regulator [Phaeacidiphilus oryzae]
MDGNLMLATELAECLGVSPSAVRKWKQREKLQPAGLDHLGRPLYRYDDAAEVEYATRQRSGRDPLVRRTYAPEHPDRPRRTAA